jgi:hypothetical protein
MEDQHKEEELIGVLYARYLDNYINEPCESLTAPDGYPLTDEGK